MVSEPAGESGAEIQVKAETLAVVARTASADEKPRLWKIVAGCRGPTMTSTSRAPTATFP